MPEVFLSATLSDAEGKLIGCQDPHFAKAVYQPDRPMDEAHLEYVVRRAADNLFRMKGVVPVVGGAVRVDMTPAGLIIEPVFEQPDPDAFGLAVIAAPDSIDFILTLLSEPTSLASTIP